MLFSKTWLQTYIQETLPDDKALADVITFNAFEIEEITKSGEHSIYDIKVLPNRAHDAFGHRGMARDIAALLGFTFIDRAGYYNEKGDESVPAPHIVIEDKKACTKFASASIEGVAVGESPAWLKEALEGIGQRSINNIVDVTNFVQFAINKPMHAYDRDLVKGGELRARFARAGEKLTTLDDKELDLDEKTLIIADTEKPLGLAGIKGGKYSGISEKTTSLILESANFNAPLIRKTAQRYGVRTDASKRFENEIADSLVEEGLRLTISLIQKLCPDARVSPLVIEGGESVWNYVTSVSVREVEKLLGGTYSESDIQKVLQRLGFSYEKASTRKMIERRLREVSSATYKRDSSMRHDAPDLFSCSSLLSFLYNGVWQPSISIDKYVYGEKIGKEDLVYGDFIFSNSGTGRIYTESVSFLPGTKVPEGIDHVGMYAGDGNVLHISKDINAVTVEKIEESKMFSGNLLFARMCDIDEERFFVTVPNERLDIRIKEDLIEEIARVLGLTSVRGVLPKLSGAKGKLHKRLYYETKIKNILLDSEYSEIYTYTFGDTGDVSILKALMDKKKLRSSLASGLSNAFSLNMNNAALLGAKEIRVFEFGNVFTKGAERRHFAFAVDDGAKKSKWNEEADLLLVRIKKELGVSHLDYEVISQKPYIVEVDFDALIESLPETNDLVFLDGEVKERGMQATYAKISPFPCIVRDIAVWVPENVTFPDLKLAIEKVLESDAHLIARPLSLFDEFTKDGRTSYAFRLVIQSHEKTLTDVEANAVADKVYTYLKEKGYEVR